MGIGHYYIQGNREIKLQLNYLCIKRRLVGLFVLSLHHVMIQNYYLILLNAFNAFQFHYWHSKPIYDHIVEMNRFHSAPSKSGQTSLPDDRSSNHQSDQYHCCCTTKLSYLHCPSVGKSSRDSSYHWTVFSTILWREQNTEWWSAYNWSTGCTTVGMNVFVCVCARESRYSSHFPLV